MTFLFKYLFSLVVYTAEEERLWNMVRANCLDFNSWTALIDETEKAAEVSSDIVYFLEYAVKLVVFSYLNLVFSVTPANMLWHV